MADGGLSRPAANLEGTADPGSTVQEAYWAWSDRALISRAHRLGVAAATRLVADESRRNELIRRGRVALHRGDRVECPICGSRFRHFMARWNREDVICWSCGSEERHRTLWIYLTRQRPDLLRRATAMLHFAPEPGLESHLRARLPRYVSADLDPGRADVAIDITAIDLPDASFDAVICSHVLEHVPDDAAAMRELRRILTPGGWAIVMVPLAPYLEQTLEDASVTDPAERRRVFWQEDHVRLYGNDVADRLRAAGLDVERSRPAEALTPAERARYRLAAADDVFLCRPG